jgi:hypothetical protein
VIVLPHPSLLIQNLNILLAAKREINLGTKTIDSKKKYSRKTKHKKGI